MLMGEMVEITNEEYKILLAPYKSFNPGDIVTVLIHPGNYKFGRQPHRIVNLVELYKTHDDIVYEVEDPTGKISRWSSCYLYLTEDLGEKIFK
jgi:hypothetical protein